MQVARPLVARLFSAAIGASLLASACGSSDDPFGIDDGVPSGDETDADIDPLDDPDNDEILATGLQVLVSAYGTSAGGAVDGFERWDGGCEVAADYDGPQLSTGDISVPTDWVPIGQGDGIRLSIGDVEKNLTAFLSQQDAGIGSAAVLDNMFGTIDYEIVGSVQVGSSSFDVGFGGGAYRMTSLAGEVRGNASVDLYHELNFGLSGSGDTQSVPLDDVLAAFQSFTIDSCVVDNETLAFAERTFEIID